MKNLKEFITEGKKHIDRTTIGDFAKWACLGELPDGKDGKVEPEDCEGLLDNGWFDNFDDSDPKKTCKEILKNPIIIGIVCGILYSFFELPYPLIVSKTVDSISNLASPLGLIAMGASFDFEKSKGSLGSSCIASFMKCFGFCMLFLPLAIYFGFVKDQIVAILIMLGSATTVTCFVMAKNMGHEGTLSSNVVMITTLLSGFSITFWLFILKSLSIL